MTSLRRPDLLLLLLALFLAVWAGGYPLMDAMAWPGGLSVLTGSAETARTTRLLIGILIFLPLGTLLVRNRAVVGPRKDLQLALAGLLVFLAFPIMASPFPFVGLDSWLNWALFAGAFLLAVMASGRREGPLVILGAAAVIGALVAVFGIRQYGLIRHVEPTFRIFAGWSNPNAVASLFVVCIPVGMALATRPQLAARLGGSLATGLCVAALFLTQSKGGLLAAGIAIGVFLLLLLIWKGSRSAWIGPILGLAIGGLLFFGIQNAPRAAQGPAGAPLGRLSASSTETEQSAGFRTLLWRTSLELIQERPLGWGPGVFRFVSGKPGLVTQTATAHQLLLQTAVDGGIPALAALIFLAFAWLRRVVVGAKSLLEEQNLLRAGVIAAVAGAGAHGMVESNLAYVGLGVLLFALMGVGLQLSSDGTSPELVPLGLRRMAAYFACGGTILLLAASSSLERDKGQMLAEAGAGQRPASVPLLGFLDGESSYVAAVTGAVGENPIPSLEAAVRTHPSTKALRMLARAQSRAGDSAGALTALAKAISYDPNNLAALWLRLQVLQDSGNTPEAIQAAEDLIERESRPSFQVRSLAEMVPTETYRARLWLAQQNQTPAERTRLVTEASKGMAEFARLTVPVIVRFAEGGQVYPGGSIQDAAEWLEEALASAKAEPSPSQDLRESIEAMEAGLERVRSASL